MTLSAVFALGMNGALAECPVSAADFDCPPAATQPVCDDCKKTDCGCKDKCKDECDCKKPCDCKEDCGCKKDCDCKDKCGCEKKQKKKKDKCCNPCNK